jgi:hypothetical protein
MKTNPTVYKFENLATAMSFRFERCIRPMRIILGDDDRFWVVTPAQAENLTRTGYEVLA